MCLVVFAWQAHPRYPLIVAANRDEFFARPTEPAGWSADDSCLSGIDLRGGGTWMGVARAGRFAALTNHRDPAAVRAGTPSRGGLCVDVLASESVERTMCGIAATADRYNGFNLLGACWAGDDPGLWIVDSASPSRKPIVPGVHGLSNARLDTPWPKVERAQDRVAAAVARKLAGDALIDHLFATLVDDAVAPNDDLPVTGIPLDLERALSAAFIRLPDYGTRSSTVLLVDDAGRVTFVERLCDPGAPVAARRFVFDTAA